MSPYFDAHCETLYRCMEPGESGELDYGDTRAAQLAYFAKSRELGQNEGHIDLVRGREFSRYGQVFALFHDGKYPPHDGMWAQCNRIHDFFLQQMEENADLVRHCRNGAEIDNAVENGKVAALLSIEGADLIDCDPSKIETVAQWGVRILNPVWNRANVLSGSHIAQSERGLSEQGRGFIRELYRHHIHPDVSHLSDRGFWDLVEMGEGAIVATHSNARSLCSHSRNLTDDQFCAIRDSGGVVGINLYLHFVGEPTMDALVRHVEHFLNLGGEKTLCLGGDLDGCEVLAAGMEGVQDILRLYDALRARGYSAELLGDIFWSNLRRLF